MFYFGAKYIIGLGVCECVDFSAKDIIGLGVRILL